MVWGLGFGDMGIGAMYSGSVTWPGMEDFWQTEVPHHVLINNMLLKSRQDSENRVARFSNQYDLPTIEQGIRDAHDRTAERMKFFDDALAKMGEAPPAMPTQVNTTPGEGAAMILGLLAGDREAPNSVYKLAEKRGGIAFQNETQRYTQRQRMAGINLDRASRDIDYYRNLGRAREEDLQHGKEAIAGLTAQMGAQEAGFAHDIDLKKLTEFYDRASQERRQKLQLALQTHQGEIEQNLAKVRATDQERAMRIEATLKGLAAMEEDPHTPDSQIDATIQKLKESGFELPAGAAEVYKNLAHANWGDRQFKQESMRMEQEMKRATIRHYDRSDAVDEFRAGALPGSLGKGPGGGFISTVIAPTDGDRPDFGPVERDYQQLKETTINASAAEQHLAQLKESGLDDTDPDVIKAKAAVTEAQSLVGSRRQDVLRKMSPTAQLWLGQTAQSYIDQINALKPDAESDLAMGIGGQKPGTELKMRQDEIRRKFKEETGFSLDDKRIEALRQKVAKGSQPVAVSGPIGGKQ